mmetsp:Transcript_11326/g.33622  ORF Transcript_11326/g.33622 Transcript_11326/m.33622 type:complete len:234 (+) Transcript_11326:124-825(+)
MAGLVALPQARATTRLDARARPRRPHQRKLQPLPLLQQLPTRHKPSWCRASSSCTWTPSPAPPAGPLAQPPSRPRASAAAAQAHAAAGASLAPTQSLPLRQHRARVDLVCVDCVSRQLSGELVQHEPRVQQLVEQRLPQGVRRRHRHRGVVGLLLHRNARVDCGELLAPGAALAPHRVHRQQGRPQWVLKVQAHVQLGLDAGARAQHAAVRAVRRRALRSGGGAVSAGRRAAG